MAASELGSGVPRTGVEHSRAIGGVSSSQAPRFTCMVCGAATVPGQPHRHPVDMVKVELGGAEVKHPEEKPFVLR